MVYQLEIEHLQKAYRMLMRRFTDEGGRGVELADAIDHIGSAIQSLGAEPKED